MQVLINSNPDFLAIETIPEIAEARAILELLNEVKSEIPFWLSFSCRSESEISSGELFSDAAALLASSPFCLGVGINCTAPAFIAPLMSSVKTGSAFVIYPNAGREWSAITKTWLGDQSSAFTASQVDQWISLGAVIIGGCCGVGPADIAQIKNLI